MAQNFNINVCAGLGSANAVLTATTRSYHVPDFDGPLSIKAVFSGSAVLAVESRQLIARSNSFVVVNDRQRYSFTIESLEPTSMFCLFFGRGFVEDVWRTTVSATGRLIDDWGMTAGDYKPRVFERVEPRTASILPSLNELRRFIASHTLTRARWDESFIRIATELVQSEKLVRQQMSKLPAMKASTRLELCRRLIRGRDYLLSFSNEPLRLADVARHACLSPYHFHRAFTRFFGKTPHRCLIDYRLSRAAGQLRHTNSTATEICLQNGFESFPSFSRSFRRRYGMSPREYRRANGAR